MVKKILILFFSFFFSLIQFAYPQYEQNPEFPGDVLFEFPCAKGVVGAHAEVCRLYYSALPRGKVGLKQLEMALKKSKDGAGGAERSLNKVLNEGETQRKELYFVRGTLYLLNSKFSEALADFYSTLTMDTENRYAADGAYIALKLIWPSLSDEQRFDWSFQIGTAMGGRVTTAANKKAEDFLLPARLMFEIGEYDKALFFVESGLGMGPENKDLILAREMCLARLVPAAKQKPRRR